MAKKSVAHHWDNIFTEEFAKEGDRASVILSEAMLDRALETIFKAYLVPTNSAQDSLLDGAYAPIATFSARIDLAYRLGLISARFCRDLHIIRKIRNDFAHNISSCNFEDSAVRSRITELVCSSTIIERDPKIRRSFPEGPRGDFQMIVSWMLWCLWSQSEQIHSTGPSDIEWGYWTKEMEEEIDEEIKHQKDK